VIGIFIFIKNNLPKVDQFIGQTSDISYLATMYCWNKETKLPIADYLKWMLDLSSKPL
tara:strand:- start:63 stop:236 length:174 start_codon:yes stop_codon:yes gene_type:complete